MSQENTQTETLSVLELLQTELKKGGVALDTLTAQLTDGIYEQISTYNIMSDNDALYDIAEKSVKATIGSWVGGAVTSEATTDDPFGKKKPTNKQGLGEK